MKFIDLETQYSSVEKEVNKRIQTVLEHGMYIMGPEVEELEKKLALFVGAKNCVAVSSGTDALLIALMALNIKQGDEVITTPFTFISTGEVISLLGAKPVFVDIDPRTYNIDFAKIESAITPRTKAIMPVSLYGQCADFDEINAIALKYDIPVIEDAAQSFGATYKGRKSCSLSTIACTSFFPSKPLGGYGDSGACFTDNDEIANIMRQIRGHGQDRRYHHPRLGVNGRMDTIQAAILLAKLEIFDGEVKSREEIGERYTKLILECCDGIIPPYIEEQNTSVYAQYTVLVENRDEVQKALSKENIPTAIHYPIPLNRQPIFETESYKLDVADNVSKKVMSLPMHPYLSEEEQFSIVQTMSNI